MDLGVLIEGLRIEVARGDAAGVRVCDVTEDSRTAVPGSLFIARRGGRFDGRRHAAAAVECGAVAVLSDDAEIELGRGGSAVVLVADDVAEASAAVAERFYGNPSSALVLVGVTGTNGKTTVASLVHQLLNGAGQRCGLIGTVEVDDGREVASASMTTPPAVELSRMLASMVESGCVAASMEVSSHALAQRRVDGLSFDVSVFTNLSGDHLDYHGTMEAYAGAKRRLFELLRPDGVGVVNVDDAFGAELAGPGARRCSAGGRGSWGVSVESESIDGMGVRIAGPDWATRSQTTLIGLHNAMNLLEAAAAADVVLERAGVDPAARRDRLGRAIGGLRSPAGRMERVSGPEDAVTVFVDYAHTDDALDHVLGSVGGLCEGELWAVFGCGGDRDRTKRERMGRVAFDRADRVVVTSDNPRTEPPGDIVAEIIQGLTSGERRRAIVHVDRRRAIREAVLSASAGDVVVIAGKGHETYQEIAAPEGGTRRVVFDDRVEARAVLRERRLRAAPDGVADPA